MFWNGKRYSSSGGHLHVLHPRARHSNIVPPKIHTFAGSGDSTSAILLFVPAYLQQSGSQHPLILAGLLRLSFVCFNNIRRPAYRSKHWQHTSDRAATLHSPRSSRFVRAQSKQINKSLPSTSSILHRTSLSTSTFDTFASTPPYSHPPQHQPLNITNTFNVMFAVETLTPQYCEERAAADEAKRQVKAARAAAALAQTQTVAVQSQPQSQLQAMFQSQRPPLIRNGSSGVMGNIFAGLTRAASNSPPPQPPNPPPSPSNSAYTALQAEKKRDADIVSSLCYRT